MTINLRADAPSQVTQTEPQKLTDEIKNGSWIIANNHNKIEFNKDSKKLWGDYMKKMSTEFKIWSNAPENPQSN